MFIKVCIFLCLEKGEILLCRHFGRLSFRQSDVIFFKLITYDTVGTECTNLGLLHLFAKFKFKSHVYSRD